MRLMLLLFALLVTGCATTKTPTEAPPAQAANPFGQFYKPYAQSPSTRSGMPARIYRGQDQETDYRRLLEDGYDILGYSSFVAGDVPPEQALEQARKLDADIVLVYTRRTGMVPLMSKNKPSPEGQSKEGQQTGRLLTPQAPQYEYFASYWTRLPPPVLGLHVKNPVKDANGLSVVAVIKNSPAAQADIQAGDMLLRIGDTDIRNVEALTQATQRYAGQQVEIVFAHDAETLRKTVVLNARNN